MKKILVSLGCGLFLVIFAVNGNASCPVAAPTTDAQFCDTFKAAAVCDCAASGLPHWECQNLDSVYSLMMLRYETLENACASQHEVSAQSCVDAWNCYRLGGSDSQGGLCSGTGNACE